MSIVPIRAAHDTAADRDLARCEMIGNVSQALDIAANTLEGAAKLIVGLMEAGGVGPMAPDTVRGINIVIVEARKIADNARSSIA